ncbi:long-chain-fatty-acid--CoA ligase [Halorientalis litorea]|uniref:long-chain-fatty-acid--CoA ligase n=1 Tax=Halorientalis litorea TaxID=2931977 RepID=UPI001FF60158|nr:long-chain fatty acid--CoA ligase [Halorientalis litorea]
MTNLVTGVAEAVERYPEQTAISFRGQEISYEGLWHRTGQLAQAFADAGVEPGDRVGVYLPNLPQFVLSYYGVLRAGGVVVPMNPQYKTREIGHMLSDSEATAVVALADLLPFVREVQDDTGVETVVAVGGDAEGATEFDEFLAADTLDTVDRADDDVAAQPYTSGTTGTPKGVLLTHENLGWMTRHAGDVMEEDYGPGDKLLGVLPLFHIYGMTVVMNAGLYNGATYYPLPEWDAETALSLIEDEGLTIMHGVPAMYNDVINQPDAADYDLSSLRFVNSGGASIPIEVIDRFEDIYGIQLNEGYGLTETSPITHANRPGARRKGSIGKPIPGVDAKIVDHDFEEMPRVEEGPVDEDEVDLDDVVGEVVVSGPNVMQGYHGRPEANEQAFTEAEGKTWFHTEDLGYWDEDNFFYVVDREKHMIVTGGYNVYPREVEELLFEHPDVADAAVVGIPDERRGETVKAFIVPTSAASGGSSDEGGESDGVPTPDAEATPEDITQYCLEHLAEYKHPREVEFVEELPRTTTGKVQKFELREGEQAE